MRILFSVDLPKASDEAFSFVEQLRATLKRNHADFDGYVLGDSVSLYDIRETFKGDLRNITLVSVLSILLIVLGSRSARLRCPLFWSPSFRGRSGSIWRSAPWRGKAFSSSDISF